MNHKKNLFRSTSDRVLFGVLGGISEYFNWNSLLVRILYVIVALTPGLGFVAILGYIVMTAIIPASPNSTPVVNQFKDILDGISRTNRSRKTIHNVEEQDVEKHKRG